jgi:AAHS family 4-hydroxybenzoate transporter-like MFS transporter
MALNISEVLDTSPLNRFHLRVVGLCACLIFFDGFDLTTVSYAAPELARALGVSRPMLGPVFSAGLVGLTLGALLFGLLGDRIGRKRAFVAAGLLFGLATLATATANSLTSLMLWRVVTGIGLGGATPLSITIASDFCPRRLRATLTMLMYCAFTIGGVVGGAAAAGLMQEWGWRAVFVVGGILPLLLAPFLMLFLPETVQFLVLTGRTGRVGRLLAKLNPTSVAPADGVYVLADDTGRGGFQVAELFRHGYAPRTLLLWWIFFVTLVALFFYTTWLPTLLNGQGISPGRIVAITGASQFGGLAGSLLVAWLMIYLRPFTIISMGYAIAAVAMLALAWVGNSTSVLLVANFLVGVFLIGTQNALNANAAPLYPPAMRSTGVGWGIGIGRIGGVLGPSIAGLLLALHLPPTSLFMLAAAPPLLAAAIALAIGRAAAVQPAQHPSNYLRPYGRESG